MLRFQGFRKNPGEDSFDRYRIGIAGFLVGRHLLHSTRLQFSECWIQEFVHPALNN